MTEPSVELDPADLNGYLASRGWRREGTSRGAFVWGLEPGCRLVVPERREYDDDDELLAEAVRQLATFEERPEPDVLLDICEPMVDTQFYRMHPDTPSGTIPLPAGLKAVQSVHNLMRAAAITVERGPQLVIEGRRDALVDRFLRRVSLGSARPGSYVLTSRVPVEPGGQAEARQQQLDLLPTATAGSTVPDSGELSGRGVVSKLYLAIRVAHTAARSVSRRGEFDAFYEGVEQGLSANICSALADLGLSGGRHPGRYRAFEVGFGWARGMPADGSREPVSFSQNMIGILVAAGEELARLARSGRARIAGQVETLKRGPGEQPRIKIIGDLQIEAGTILGRRSVWVVVSTADYEAAWEAQQNGWTVIVDGQLGTKSGRLQMQVGRIQIGRR